MSAAHRSLLSFPDENILKKISCHTHIYHTPNISSQFNISYVFATLYWGSQYVLGFPTYCKPCLRGRSLHESWSSSLVAGRRRQLGCKQPGSFPGKLLAAGRVSLVAAGGHKEAGDTTKLHMWLAEDWCQMVPTRSTPYDHNPHLRFSCRADNVATVKN